MKTEISFFRISNGALAAEKFPVRLKLLNWGDNQSLKGVVRVGPLTLSALANNQKTLGFDRIALDYEHNTVPGTPAFVADKPPNPVVSSVTTGTVTGVATNYDYTYTSTNIIGGSAGDYDYIEYPIGEGWSTSQPWNGETEAPEGAHGYIGPPFWGGHGWICEDGAAGWVGPFGPYGGEWTTPGTQKYQTNIITSGGSEGTAEDHNAILSSTTEIPSSTYQTNITSSIGISGAGVGGEIDYYWEELAGQRTNYTRRAEVAVTEGTSNNYDYTTVSSYTIESTMDHYNRTTSRTNHDRIFVWTAVSNLLAEYMVPWVVDHANHWTSGNDDYKDRYLFNYGWSPSYSNSTWRLYSDIKYPTNFNYFWNWSEINHRNKYEYFKANTNSSAPSWHYPRSYSYYWKYPTEVVGYDWEDWYDWYWCEGFGFSWIWDHPGEITTNYCKYQDQLNYVKYTYTTNYVITENRYTIKYQMFPSNPPLYTVPSFFEVHSNALGNTNWLLSPTYLSETQSITSFDVLSVTNDGVISTWTNYVVTNTMVTRTAVYSNDWAISLWGGSFIQRHKAVDLLLWTTNTAWLESETRWVTTTNITACPGWTTLYVTTNLTAGAYESSIYKGGWIAYNKDYTFKRSRIRAHRKPGGILDGQIDTYLKFGTVISGRYDIDNLGYPFGRYVRVTELTIPAGSMYSDWIGRIDTLPSYPDLEGYSWDHPYGFTIQNTSVSPIFIFQPVFAP